MERKITFSLGDIVNCLYDLHTELQIFSIAKSANGLLYTCIVTNGSYDDLGKEITIDETNLTFVRGATKSELEILLDIAVEDENYLLASDYKKLIEMKNLCK